MYEELVINTFAPGTVIFDANTQAYWMRTGGNFVCVLDRMKNRVGMMMDGPLFNQPGWYFVGDIEDVDIGQEPKQEVYQYGDIVKLDDGSLGLISQVSSGTVQLIHLDSGNRFDDPPIEVKDVSNISQGILQKLTTRKIIQKVTHCSNLRVPNEI